MHPLYFGLEVRVFFQYYVVNSRVVASVRQEGQILNFESSYGPGGSYCYKKVLIKNAHCGRRKTK